MQFFKAICSHENLIIGIKSSDKIHDGHRTISSNYGNAIVISNLDKKLYFRRYKISYFKIDEIML